ncbi:hypothetical protein BASA81_012281 [Batrachochytrium salamandrivorans]|nr:hypothetical protein BASA81_012281 [Batrachochytrium salamandrivorans]
MSTKKLTRRQARWSLELSEYDFSITHRPGKLNGRADALSRQSDHHLENDCSNFKRILDPKQILDLQSLISEMDLHVIVHSEVLQKVFVLESDWPLIIADFLAGEDNVWMDDIPEVTLEKCKKELKNFRFRDDTFLRILEDGKSTATYVHYEQRSKVARHYHESLAHLKYGSIIGLITRRFWWPTMKKDIKDFIARCPQCQLNQSALGIHAPLPIRPVPPVALPFERWGIDLFERENKIRHLATTPYHPQTNGMVERMHAMLGHGLTTLTNESRDRWDEFLPQTLLALRTRTHAESSEFIARNLEEVGQARSAANVRTKAQAEAMRKRSGFDENTPDYYFKVGDMVKMKHHDRLKLEFKWKGPYHVVDVGHPGTYWIMTPQGLRLPNAVNQNDLAPWLSPVVDNVDFFYDGTSRNSGSF